MSLVKVECRYYRFCIPVEMRRIFDTVPSHIPRESLIEVAWSIYLDLIAHNAEKPEDIWVYVDNTISISIEDTVIAIEENLTDEQYNEMDVYEDVTKAIEFSLIFAEKLLDLYPIPYTSSGKLHPFIEYFNYVNAVDENLQWMEIYVDMDSEGNHFDTGERMMEDIVRTRQSRRPQWRRITTQQTFGW